MSYIILEYPALIYKNKKNDTYVANCITKKLVGYGSSEKAAILNLEQILNKNVSDYPVRVKPVYKFLPNLVEA